LVAVFVIVRFALVNKQLQSVMVPIVDCTNGRAYATVLRASAVCL